MFGSSVVLHGHAINPLNFSYSEAWEAHTGIRIEGNHLTCEEDAKRCPECGPSKRHWPGARYLKRLSPEFPHFEVGDDNPWHSEENHCLGSSLSERLVMKRIPVVYRGIFHG